MPLLSSSSSSSSSSAEILAGIPDSVVRLDVPSLSRLERPLLVLVDRVARAAESLYATVTIHPFRWRDEHGPVYGVSWIELNVNTRDVIGDETTLIGRRYAVTCNAMSAVQTAGGWLADRLLRYAEALDRAMARADEAQFERIELLDQVRLLIARDDENDEVLRYNEPFVSLHLLFQWYLALTVLPEELEPDDVNFSWNGVFLNVYCTYSQLTRERQIASSSLIQQQQQQQQQQQREDVPTTKTAARQEQQQVRVVLDEPLGGLVTTVLARVPTRRSKVYDDFIVTDGKCTLYSSSRKPTPAKVITLEEVCDGRFSRVFKELRPPSNSNSSRSSSSSSSSSSNSAAAFATKRELTEEQKRVVSLLSRLVFEEENNNEKEKEKEDERGRKTTTTITKEEPVPRRSDLVSTAARRVLVDGVAGSGKTFLLAEVLRRFERVEFLAKTRNAVDSTIRRFVGAANLTARTADAYLMARLNIRSLPAWLRARENDMDSLRERAQRNRETFDPRVLYFIDEYTLLEGSLAELLNLTLHECRVIVTGDCNQQSAIGDSEDQAVRTLLGYETVAFMYSNVRAKDSRLRARLNYFYARLGCPLYEAVRGLPERTFLDVRDLVRAVRRGGGTSDAIARLLPRAIVVSNVKANFLNWAIGWMVQRYARNASDCLAYRREIVAKTRDDEERLRAKTDDAYADEQFLVRGATYRMIHSRAHWPLRVGARVILEEISSPELVVVRASATNALYNLRKTIVRPYEYGSVWNEPDARERVAGFRMFPFVLDVASSVYQIQGVTLGAAEAPRCYIDCEQMNEKSLYVALSRFETEDQIRGVANAAYLDRC